MPFVSSTLFMFSFFLFVSFYHWFSLLFLLPFHIFCLCLFLCFLLSFSFFVSFYCFSFFFLDLPSVAWFSLHIWFLFLPPSPLPSLFSSSFPLLLFLPSPISLLLFVPVVGYSSFSSSPSFSPSFSNFLFPFGSACLSVASSFSFPAISLPHSYPFLSLSLLLHFLLTLLPFGLTSLLFAVFLFDAFLFPLSLLSLFSSFFSV